MNFEIPEEQQLLIDTLKRWVAQDYGFETRRAIVGSAAGWDQAKWQQMAEMGVVSLAIDEAHGGFGAGALGMVSVVEGLGGGLLVEPLQANVGPSLRLLQDAGSQGGADALLQQVASGEACVTLAYLEAGSRYDALTPATQAVADGDSWRLSGRKVAVMHAGAASTLLVSASFAGGGVGVFAVSAQAAGLTVKAYRTVDSLRAADLALDGVSATLLIGAAGSDAGAQALEAALDWGALMVAAEAVGVMAEANTLTLEYLKTRKQFGMPIGAFQALQHRMVDMTIVTEQTRSILYLAASTFDAAQAGRASAGERRRLVSAAKIKMAEACRQVSQEAVQLHGGMGMTQEMKVSHTFRRLTVLAQEFGDLDFHLERYRLAA